MLSSERVLIGFVFVLFLCLFLSAGLLDDGVVDTCWLAGVGIWHCLEQKQESAGASTGAL